MFLKMYQLAWFCLFFPVLLKTALPYFLSSFMPISNSFLVSELLFVLEKERTTAVL